MPFQSEKQRRYLHANHPEIAKRWERDYANGGILDLNESEEIISDDGNDIELTDYNAAFDDPNDLSTGVKSLFQAKDGGRIGFQGGGADQGGWGPGAGSPGTTSSGGNKNTGGSDRGPRDDPDRFGPVSKPQTVPGGINIHEDTGKEEEAYVMVGGQKVPQSVWGTGADPREKDLTLEETYYGPTLTNKKIKILEDKTREYILRNLKALDPNKYYEGMPGWKATYEKLSSLPTPSLIGILTAMYKEHKLTSEGNAILEEWGTYIGGPPGTNPQAYDDLWLALEKRKAKYRKDDDTGGPDGPPSILNPVTLEVDEEYAQGDYDFDQWSNWNAMKQKQLLNAQKQEQWRAEKEAYDQSFLLANSGGLANLFRVKNQ